MSRDLATAIDNAEYLLGTAIPAFADGRLGELTHAHGIGTNFRSRGISQLLLRGVVDPLQVAQMQSSSAYVFALRRVTDDDEKVTSLAGCFWDAVSAQYWAAAQEIAKLSRMTANPKREHEDDFLYVAFLMQRYFLEARVETQDAMLERWTIVLEGGLDARLDLCRALRVGDGAAFEEAIVAMSDARDADLVRRHKKGKLKDEQLAWLRPLWPEGLALLRLAQRDGLADEALVVPRVPPVVVVDNPYVYDPNAWRVVAFQPSRRS